MEFDKEEIILKKENKIYVSEIESLGILAEGKTQNQSLKNLKIKYYEYKDFVNKNKFKEIRKKKYVNKDVFKKDFLLIFKKAFLKFISNLFFFIITLIIILSFLKSEILKVNYSKFSRGGDFFDKVVQELDKAAQEKNDIDPKLQEEILEDLRKVLSRSKPFIDEIKFLFKD
jgi:hypothetical protein